MPVDGALILTRFVHFAAMMLLFGSAAFCLYAGAAGERLQRRWTVLPAAVALLSALAWFGLFLGELSEDQTVTGFLETLRLTVFETTFGTIWVVHLALAALALTTTLCTRRCGRIAGAGAALLASEAWIGHAIIGAGVVRLAHVGVHVLHLLATATWVGGLPILATRVARAYGGGDSTAIAQASLALRRFSGVGIAAVALIAISGLANAAFLLGWPSDLRNPYAAVLAGKIGLFVAMTAVASYNRLRLLPRLASAGTREALRRFGRPILVEQILGALVLVAASLLGTMTPGA